MKKVVLLAPYFLPRRRVAVWRPFKFAIHLKKFGWKPHIITLGSKGTITPNEKRLLTDIPIYTIKPPFDLTYKSESSKSITEQKYKSKSETTKAFSTVSREIDRHFPVDTWLPLFLMKMRYLKRIISIIKPALIWSTGDPWSSHVMAYRLKRKFNIPWVADFRDPWTLGGLNLKKRSKFSVHIDKHFEDKIIKNASMLTFTSKATEKLYRDYYKKININSSTIYNCFDKALYNETTLQDSIFEKDKLNLLFFGSFRSRSPANTFIQILKRLYELDEDIARKVRMYSFGSLNEQDKKEAIEAGVVEQFIELTPIPPEQALGYFSEVDLLWMNTNKKIPNVIPAKLWDYLAAKKPILSITSNPEIADILNKTKTGIQFKENQQLSATKFLRRCVNLKIQEKRLSKLPFFSPDEDKINYYDAEHSTLKLSQIFDRLV